MYGSARLFLNVKIKSRGTLRATALLDGSALIVTCLRSLVDNTTTWQQIEWTVCCRHIFFSILGIFGGARIKIVRIIMTVIRPMNY